MDYLAVFEAAPDAMVTFAHEGAVFDVNERLENLFGYSRDQLLDQSVELFVPGLLQAARARGKSGELVPKVGSLSQLYGLRRDGSRFAAEITISRMRDAPESLTIAVIREDELRTLLSAAPDPLVKLLQAQEAIRIRDDLLSVASHELKTPLVTLQIQAESAVRAIEQRNDEAVVPTVHKKLQSMFASIRRLASLIDQLLDLTRVTAGRLNLQRQRIDLSALATAIANQFRDDVRCGCEVRLFAELPVWGNWDPVRIEQIVTNLISNAVKYGAGKPIEVMVTEVPDRKARLSVRDHGIGIPSEHRDRIFERFERVVSSREYGGLGLGLWIVRQIVEAHDGSITVWSEPEEGSIFTVDLPLGVSEQPPLETQRAPEGTSIMLVDDDAMTRNTFCEILKDHGFKVFEASNGRDALQLLRSGTRPNLIVLDLVMPEMDGWGFRAEQEKSPELSEIPVIVVSAADGIDKIAEGLGVAGYLKKPFELDPLFRAIDRCLGEGAGRGREQHAEA